MFKIEYTETYLKKYLEMMYFYENTYNENMIDKMDRSINLALDTLTIFPSAFEQIFKTHYRRFFINDYVIIYEIKDDVVIVSNMFKSKEDYLLKI